MARLIKIADIARRKPAVLHDRFSKVRLVIVTAHDTRPFNKNLAIVGDRYVNTIKRSAHRPDTIILGPISRYYACFGHPITLQDWNASGEERVRECRRKRGSP